MKKILFTLALGLSLTASAKTKTSQETITIKNSWVRLLPGKMSTGAFMEITNSSNKDISLIKATSDVSQITEIHDHVNVDGMMKMVAIPKLSIPAGQTITLKPGSLHIMLIELKKPLVAGQKINIKLEFDNKTTFDLNTSVEDKK